MQYIYFRTDGYYGFPEAILKDKFPGFLHRDELMSEFANASYGPIIMHGADELDTKSNTKANELYDDYGNQEICQTVYYLKCDTETFDHLQDVLVDINGGEVYGNSLVSGFEEAVANVCGFAIVFNTDRVYFIGIGKDEFDSASGFDGSNLSDHLSSVGEEEIKEISCVIINGGGKKYIVDYLKNKRGYSDDDIENLELMARMKKRSKYT